MRVDAILDVRVVAVEAVVVVGVVVVVVAVLKIFCTSVVRVLRTVESTARSCASACVLGKIVAIIDPGVNEIGTIANPAMPSAFSPARS